MKKNTRLVVDSNVPSEKIMFLWTLKNIRQEKYSVSRSWSRILKVSVSEGVVSVSNGMVSVSVSVSVSDDEVSVSDDEAETPSLLITPSWPTYKVEATIS